MSDCSWLADRIPVVASGQAEWTADEARHLSGCRSCQDEWELVRRASRLGEGLPGIDVGATAQALLRRLKHAREQRLRRRAWSFAGVAAAATIAAVVWTERPMHRPTVPTGASVVAGLQIPLPELDSLRSAELDSVLRTMDEPSVGDSKLEAPGSGDIDNEELENVLDS